MGNQCHIEPNRRGAFKPFLTLDCHGAILDCGKCEHWEEKTCLGIGQDARFLPINRTVFFHDVDEAVLPM
eukprot:CAMPEP_0172844716 /NCGR_PEP_ID=MMETSP1075-20121228/32433_1 /TAXON_ID=2916 /ORGANISM="Ceratium fusus, Strain PA161109" /LENGTH=69 /DNA_ID=CAMNT_0013689223 /DNA_START=61 /DNA_END=267 /DNA_ORIENTATION=+